MAVEIKPDQIREVREFMSMSLEEFGQLMDKSGKQISRYESGELYPSNGFCRRLQYVYQQYCRELNRKIKKTAMRAA
jgi:predicted transcriptional regulator